MKTYILPDKPDKAEVARRILASREETRGLINDALSHLDSAIETTVSDNEKREVNNNGK